MCMKHVLALRVRGISLILIAFELKSGIFLNLITYVGDWIPSQAQGSLVIFTSLGDYLRPRSERCHKNVPDGVSTKPEDHQRLLHWPSFI
jgi:hypothetical protein